MRRAPRDRPGVGSISTPPAHKRTARGVARTDSDQENEVAPAQHFSASGNAQRTASVVFP